MDFLRVIRFALFGLVLLFSLVELALCAKDIHVTKAGVFIDNGSEILLLSPFFFPFAAFGLAISVLTILFVVPIIVIDLLRERTVTSVIAFELIWTGIYWVLWLAAAAEATAPGIFKDCDFEDSRVETICHQFVAIQGLAFFNWILLFGWWITLGTLAFNLRRRSNDANLWRQSVADARVSLSDMRRPDRTSYQGTDENRGVGRGSTMMRILKGNASASSKSSPSNKTTGDGPSSPSATKM